MGEPQQLQLSGALVNLPDFAGQRSALMGPDTTR